jgi:membrane associated rhomboid family serine protease
MQSLDLNDTQGVPFREENLEEVGVFPSLQETEEHGLVVLALGWPYWVEPGNDGYRLLVERPAVHAVQLPLADYKRERGAWPPPPIADSGVGHAFAWLTPLLWSSTVLTCFVNQAPFVEAGLLSPRAMVDHGEWWRAATALFLHGSAGHVISNALSGILIFTAVVATLGARRGWCLVALAAIGANLASAIAHYPADFRSLGASTAIFAGVGLLTGRAIRVVARSRHPHRWQAMFVPLAAGLTVLALHGAGEPSIDLGAHVAGFAAGLGFGFAFGIPQRSARGTKP